VALIEPKKWRRLSIGSREPSTRGAPSADPHAADDAPAVEPLP
jgi:hypothetical protein